MKKSMIIAVMIVGILFVASFLEADNTSPASYYNDYITMKIAKCEHQATMINARSDCIRRCAKMRDLQAKFFTKHRQQLVEDMVAQNTEMKPYKVDYFLIKVFFNAHPELTIHAKR